MIFLEEFHSFCKIIVFLLLRFNKRVITKKL